MAIITSGTPSDLYVAGEPFDAVGGAYAGHTHEVEVDDIPEYIHSTVSDLTGYYPTMNINGNYRNVTSAVLSSDTDMGFVNVNGLLLFKCLPSINITFTYATVYEELAVGDNFEVYCVVNLDNEITLPSNAERKMQAVPFVSQTSAMSKFGIIDAYSSGSATIDAIRFRAMGVIIDIGSSGQTQISIPL